ncbi:beta-lactamase family protein [Frankia sp. CNm7]|uniref:Beta-lactamase family protein n=1 Tax=Frankia nepalensis TaxID=1836974 RepID=A0A937RVN5_9ACTN|nr:serine hydrolase domain-containing protein [Frankia nepalensis]MBL7512395.1 beta-lactamase family protein [Frankia nepalensis]MBL7523928.1 beta-lactamase family protein [Frankia nepalensis]MBL7632711.1 beta-lactamase family protein [Frankia nepalensis]
MFSRGRFKAVVVILVVIAGIWVLTRAVTSDGEGEASTPSPPPAAPRYGQAELQRDLDAVRDAGAVGVIAQVNGSQRLRGTSGVSDVEADTPLDVDGYFRMGSNTKPFVAIVVLQLVEEGALTLDDTVERWLPGVVTGNGNDGASITVRQLLQHTSGLHDYTDDLLARVDSMEAYRELLATTFTPRELVTLALQSPPDFSPGQGWDYSNTGYALIGMIIEEVAGRSWDTEVARRVLEPLGMAHTSEPGTATVLPDPHPKGYEVLDGTTVEHPEQNMTWAGAGGSLVTTVDDLSRFWRAVGSGELVTPELAEQMRRTVPTTGDDQPAGGTYGLGLAWRPLSCGGGAWTHNGDVPGFHTVSAVSEDGATTAVVSLNVNAEGPVRQAAWDLIDHAVCQGA